MQLTALDWSMIGGYFAVNLRIGLWYRRRAARSTTEFFACADAHGRARGKRQSQDRKSQQNQQTERGRAPPPKRSLTVAALLCVGVHRENGAATRRERHAV